MSSRTRKRFIGNTYWQLAQNIYSMVVSLIVGSLSARYLGPSNYGVLNYGSSIISVFSSISLLGLDNVMAAEMIKNPEKEGKYLGTALVLRFCASVMSFFSVWIIISVLEPHNKLVQIVTVLQALAVILNIYDVFLFWFQIKMELKYVSIATMISLTLTGAWRIYLLSSQKSVVFFALNSSLSSLFTGLIVAFVFFQRKDIKLSFDYEDGRYLLRKSYHFIISGLAIVLYTHLDSIMLGKWINSEAVGLYAAASSIAALWEFIPMSIINSARPILFEIRKKSYFEYLENYKILLFSISFLGVLYSFAIYLFGKIAILLLYGEKYLLAFPALNVLTWSTFFAMVGSSRSIWILSEDKNKFSKYYTFVGALTNVILNFVFVPKYGIIGAALTTLISQIVTALLAPMLFTQTKEFIYIYLESFKDWKKALFFYKKRL